MRVGLLVDASCDLPRSLLQKPYVRVLPIYCRVNEQVWEDDRSDRVRGEFLAKAASTDWNGQIETTALGFEEVREFVLNGLVLQFDYVFAVTAMRSRSKIYETLSTVATTIQPQVIQARAAAGIKGPFRLHVCDSSSLFSGHAAIALALAAEIEKQTVTTNVIRKIDRIFGSQTFTYFVPAGLAQLYRRAKARGDKSLHFLSYALGTALDIKPIVCGAKGTTSPAAKVRHFDDAARMVLRNVTREVRRGLLEPYVVVSVGGEESVLRAMGEFQALEDACRQRSVELHVLPMGIGAMVNAGIGGLAIGCIAEDHVFDTTV